MIEYKVLGRGTVEVNGQQVSLINAHEKGHVLDIEGALNELGKEGWELTQLAAPYVFIRRTSD